LKVAILHYWFLLNGGGEQVARSLLRVFPDADLFLLFADPKSLPSDLDPSKVHTSILQNIPFSGKLNRAMFPLYPAAVGAFDFSGYDLIFSSDYAPARSIVPPVNTLHISYTHAPGRLLWDQRIGFAKSLPAFLRPILYKVSATARDADFVGAQRVDHIIANAQHIGHRIWKYYRRESTVIYPPVNVKPARISDKIGNYYFSIGRMTELKRDDIIIEACNRLGRRLIVAGTGREEKKLRAIAGPTIEFVGRVDDAELGRLYSECRALLFAANEDFGIVPVEAQAYGRPVLAFGEGGCLETIKVDPSDISRSTGILFPEQTAESLAKAILEFEAVEDQFVPQAIRQHALQFDRDIFETNIKLYVEEAMKNWQSRPMPSIWTPGAISLRK
jgi:glycosyltransferase involved in cell wall biosynthesis